MKIIAGLLGGLLLGILGMTLASISFASYGGAGPGLVAFFSFWILGVAIAVQAPRAGKAWRRLLFTSSVLSFLLPLAGVVFTGTYLATKTDGGAQVAGAAIGGTLLSGFLGFVGFFLGVIFLVVGFLTGKDRQPHAGPN